MKTKKKRVFKVFWVWQDQKQEAWLQEMSAKGLHLKSVGLGLYYFEEGPLQKYAYRLDHQLGTQKDFAEYLELFDAAGWEYIGKFNGWQYFRKPMKAGGNMEIYTDSESKVEKFQQRLKFLALTTPGFFVVFFGALERYPVWFAVLLVSVISASILYSAINALMIIIRINQLKKK